jgi:hypothetical protein
MKVPEVGLAEAQAPVINYHYPFSHKLHSCMKHSDTAFQLSLRRGLRITASELGFKP